MLLLRWGCDALCRLYDDVMGKSDPMPGVEVPLLPDVQGNVSVASYIVQHGGLVAGD